MRILIIEDEPKLRQFLAKGLSHEGHIVDATENGTTGLEMMSQAAYDLIILDLMLPGQTGFDVLNNMSTYKLEVPVLILSALNDTEHVVKGLDLGAIDYMKKPFELDELKARIRSVERMMSRGTTTRLKVNDLEMDLVSREVKRSGKTIELTKREYALLEFLMRNAGKVLGKPEIAEKVWELNFDPMSNVVEVHMYQLRKKVDSWHEQKLIETRVGMGYVLNGKLNKI